MRDTTDHAAIAEQLGRLACHLRGLNPDHIPEGGDVPMWRSPEIAEAAKQAKNLLSTSVRV